jgi:hypothetical protein
MRKVRVRHVRVREVVWLPPHFLHVSHASLDSRVTQRVPHVGVVDLSCLELVELVRQLGAGRRVPSVVGMVGDPAPAEREVAQHESERRDYEEQTEDQVRAERCCDGELHENAFRFGGLGDGGLVGESLDG